MAKITLYRVQLLAAFGEEVVPQEEEYYFWDKEEAMKFFHKQVWAETHDPDNSWVADAWEGEEEPCGFPAWWLGGKFDTERYTVDGHDTSFEFTDTYTGNYICWNFKEIILE